MVATPPSPGRTPSSRPCWSAHDIGLLDGPPRDGHRRRRLPRLGPWSRRLRGRRRRRTSSCPAARDYDLRTRDGIRRALADGRPDLVIHLAAVVGGIGANRENPGRFFYENAIMGIQLMEQARLAGVAKFVADRHGLRVPQVHAGAVPRGRPLERLPGGDQRAVRPGQEDAARPGPGLPRSSTASTPSSCCPVNLYGPGDNFDPASSHVIPALIKKCVDAREAGADHIEVWGTGSRLARVPLRRGRRRGHRPGRRALRRRRAGQPRRRPRDHHPRPGRARSSALTGFRGRDPLGRDQARRPAAPGARHEPRPRALRLRRADDASRTGCARTVEWYEATRRVPVARISTTRRPMVAQRTSGGLSERTARSP